MIFHVRWWIGSYKDFYQIHNQVNRSLIQALKGVGVKMPYTSSSVKLDLAEGEADQLSE